MIIVVYVDCIYTFCIIHNYKLFLKIKKHSKHHKRQCMQSIKGRFGVTEDSLNKSKILQVCLDD